MVEDAVIAVQLKKALQSSNAIIIPLDQMLVILYYGLMEYPPLSTHEAQTLLQRVGISFNSSYTSLLLNELVRRKLIHQNTTSGNWFDKSVTPDRLQEVVPNSHLRSTLGDVVYAIRHNIPFTQKIKVPLSQIKVLLYYAFQGKPHMSTMDIEKKLLQMNIDYEYGRTRDLLKELASEGLVEIEERIGKTQRKYYLWKFPHFWS